MFNKILIANRGEIAVRVIRACREMGIGTVAVYSEADRAALHVRLADEAYLIGPAPSPQSYLKIDRIIETAKLAGAKAIHPGYGFLSENAEFAMRCEEEGLVFIGPSSHAIRAVGGKTAGRSLASQAGVPIVPGSTRDLTDREVLQAVQEIGLPVVIKASAGGGGKGMRIVSTEAMLGSALRATRSEAAAAFGNAAIYVERYVGAARHIEIQVMADTRGNVVYLGERECSLQRRHQKVIEESPSPFVDLELRRRMGEAAVRLAKAANYTNAGTMEFLVDPSKNFYFLEMNTRLQVEHPITEMVTGLDLVKEQIRIAAGDVLSVRQDEIRLRGHAIECRIYAEDPFNNFMPSPGRIRALRTPGGPGLRIESAIYEGCDVPIHYDPLISKLVVWGRDRGEAIARVRRALAEYVILGVKTNIPFHRQVLNLSQFVTSQINTEFLESWLATGLSPENGAFAEIALIAGALHLHTRKRPAPTPVAQGVQTDSLWTRVARQEGMRRR
ncbi:MAG: acetyl-CoA carboxylase biotin carboxylase subunit [Candidatus Methylomirabilis oxygeniifera]|uniref:Acetyl CoA carboxylase, biotin carboxylase subunit n=1 Tax=Methylomirabilis oxygeniifera TaxID=671143 RepID=D5MEU8_METO1|nr:MAG: acetyl-CoA carboxylase biotin carboxylase subunit [Candidatus Methylomirabilis oxyfera]CBE68277.1 acetyl CoA carboxylase, biotin carboxylase subunit [Candidatus Methylomirabilis oxyfera]